MTSLSITRPVGIPPNQALHRTLVNVAKITDYNRLSRVGVVVLSLLSAGEFGRWPELFSLRCVFTYGILIAIPYEEQERYSLYYDV